MREGRRIVRRCVCLLGLIALGLLLVPVWALAAPTASYTFSPNPGKTGVPVKFDASASKGAETYSWDFADGSEGTGKETEHVFAGPATYKVKLTVTNSAKETDSETQSVTVKSSQEVIFTSMAPSTAIVGATYTVTATGGASGEPVEFSTSGGGCTNSGAVVTFTTPGNCIITANQAGNAEYEQGSAQQGPITVKGTQTIKFTSTSPGTATVGSTYTVSATGGASGQPVEFSTSGGGCTNSGALVTFTAPGNCLITASQAGNGEYEAAPQAQQGPITVNAVVTITPAPSPKPSASPPPSSPPATTAKSSFKAISATLHSPSFTITLKEQVSDAGTLSWVLTFPNRDFGVFGRATKLRHNGKCKAGFMRLSGKCRPKRVTYGRGSMSFAAAGTVTITVKPSAAAKQALKTALRKKKNMRITALLTFTPRNGTAITHTQLLTVKLSSAK